MNTVEFPRNRAGIRDLGTHDLLREWSQETSIREREDKMKSIGKQGCGPD